MPLVKLTPEQQATIVTEPRQTQPEQPSEVGVGEVFKAAFKKENTVGSFINNPSFAYNGKFDPNHDPLDPDYLKGYEQYADRFVNSKNKYHSDLIKKQIDDENRNRKILDEAGGTGTLAAITANILDPVTIAGLLVAPEFAIGKTLLQTAGKTAVFGAVDQAARETILNPTQETRTFDESVLNIGIAGVMSAALGPVVQTLSPSLRKQLQGQIAQQLTNNPIPAVPHSPGASGVAPTPTVKPVTTGNAGAAKVAATTLEDETLPVIEKIVSKTRFSPNENLATSPSVHVRQLHQQLADDSYRRAKNYEGVATAQAAETAINRQTNEIMGQVIENLKSQAKNFKNAHANNSTKLSSLIDELQRAGERVDPADVMKNPKKYMSQGYFNRLVTGAARNGDTSVFPEVQAVAQLIRAKGLDPLAQAALDRGLFNDVIEAAAKRASEHARLNSPASKELQLLKEQLADAQVEKQAAQLLRLKDSLFALKQAGKEQSKGAQRIAQAIANAESKLAAKPRGQELVKKVHDDFAKRMKATTPDLTNLAYRQKFVKEIMDERLAALNKLKGDTAAKKSGLDAFTAQAAADARVAAQALHNPTAQSYVHRMWNFDQIIARRTEFLDRVEAWVRAVKPDEQFPREVADDFYTSLVSSGRLSLAKDIELVGKAGPLREKLMLIPDNQIADFLENDIEVVMNRYVREMNNDIVFYDMFGGKNLELQLGKIDDSYKELADAMTIEMKAAGKSEGDIMKSLTKLGERRDRDIEDLKWLANRILQKSDSEINTWTRTAAFLKKLNAVRSLGGMAISSIPDIGRLVWVNGASKFSKIVWSLATDKNFRKMTVEEAKRLGYGYELVLNNRFQGIADFELGQSSLRATKLEKGMDYAAQHMSLLTGMAHWNSAMKTMAGALHADRMIEGMLKYSQLGKKEIAYLAQHGIDSNMATRIAEQFKKHGALDNSFHVANVERWDDAIAKEVYSNAVYKTVNHTINTPQAGTIPKFFREQRIGNLVTQFKSFLMAMNEQTIMAGMQELDAKALQGIVTMLAMGALAYNAKQIVKGGEIETDPGKLLIHAIDVSGVAGLPWEINNIVNSMDKNSPSVQHLFDIDNTNRFRETTATEYMLGPMGGMVNDIGALAGDVISGDFRQKDTHIIRKMMPYQNLFYLRALLDQGEVLVNDSFDIRK